MKKALFASLVAACLTPALMNGADKGRGYNEPWTGAYAEHIAFPVGGIGTGMICFEGTGAISNVSLHHVPDLFHEPCTFAAISVKGVKNGSKVLETNVPDYKKFGRLNGGMGVGGTTWGLPRFDEGTFSFRFPFAKLDLHDDDLPVDVSITAWNPFIPDDEDNSGLPVGGFEYTFKNTSKENVEAVFSFNTRNFMYKTNAAVSPVSPMENGFVLNQEAPGNERHLEGHFAIFTDDPATTVDHCWFRGAWFDPLTMAWNNVEKCELISNGTGDGAPGGSLYVPVNLAPGESKTVRLYMAWHVPRSNHRIGPDPKNVRDFGSCYNEADYNGEPWTYEPWYSRRFANVAEVAAYWTENYDRLKAETESFTDAFYDTTLPDEVVEAVAANLTILKSPTVMRQHDGRFWTWEGCGDSWGSCHGSCTHVWNYAQAVPHLFPRLERSLRETEFTVDQNTDGHQVFRANLPIRPIHHDFHSAADGQLGGIMKVYREWRISGDNEWIDRLYPQIKQSMDYCISTWDPRETGAVEEPHHNTYDIEFWGPDGMCTSFYAGALNSFIQISKALGKDAARYEKLLEKSKAYMESRLWNGEYFYQDVRWKDLNAGDPTTAMTFHSTYSPEAQVILETEGPKYQYGTGCLSDGIIGCWLSLACGLDEPIDNDKVKSHLNSVYKYNLKHDLTDHSNPQRPGYAMGREGGLLLCTWPNGGKPSLPFVYSDEVWTGIEYQVAAHLIFEGEVEKGLDIVRTCRSRYDGLTRNPFNEYECGSWYARALASYSLLQALTGARYDAVTKTLYIDSKIGDFRSFLSTASGYATVGLKKGRPFIEVKKGDIEILKCIVSGKEMEISKI